MAARVPVFSASDKPAAIIDRYGEWLSGALGDGFGGPADGDRRAVS